MTSLLSYIMTTHQVGRQRKLDTFLSDCNGRTTYHCGEASAYLDELVNSLLKT